MVKQSQKREGQVASFEEPGSFVAGSRGRSRGNRTSSISGQTEKFHRDAVRRLCLAIVNRAILDALENGQQSREAEQWLLSRDFEFVNGVQLSV